jgi:hypothetical protein
VREKKYPAGVLLSPRIRIWAVSEIRALIDTHAALEGGK